MVERQLLRYWSVQGEAWKQSVADQASDVGLWFTYGPNCHSPLGGVYIIYHLSLIMIMSEFKEQDVGKEELKNGNKMGTKSAL